jgi:hypothetical protein
MPLARQALKAFKELQPIACGSRYVFPHFGDPRKPMNPTTLNVAFDRLGLTVSPPSLRATASTILNEANIFRPDVIERQLSHIERNRIRAAYNAAEYIDERRAMLQWWADFIDRPAAVVQGSKRRASKRTLCIQQNAGAFCGSQSYRRKSRESRLKRPFGTFDTS